MRQPSQGGWDRTEGATNICRIGFHVQDYILTALCLVPYVVWLGALVLGGMR